MPDVRVAVILVISMYLAYELGLDWLGRYYISTRVPLWGDDEARRLGADGGGQIKHTPAPRLLESLAETLWGGFRDTGSNAAE